MLGLVNRALQGFLQDTYGRDVWDKVRQDAGLDFTRFETMLHYEPVLTERVMLAACYRLDKPLAAFLEDVGTWIISHPDHGSIRRLLRFGGSDFEEFVFSLDELPGRVAMALPDLDMPSVSLRKTNASQAEVILTWRHLNLSAVFLGGIRAMADDYGALVLMSAEDSDPLTTVIEMDLVDSNFASGRSFELRSAAT